MCTNLLLAVPTTPGASAGPMTYVSARTLELAGTLETSIYLVPAGTTFPLVSPPTPPPMPQPARWKSQYGFLGVSGNAHMMTQFPCFMDGLNETGLSLGALWLPGTDYPRSGPSPQVFFADFGAWVLGQFATVADLATALTGSAPCMSVVGPPIPTPQVPQPYYLPLHFIATDETGASLVVEFIDGVMRVYSGDQTADGVLTNAPPYDWQRANLANYAHLDVIGPATSVASSAAPVGSGLLGMPGDPMSASRFVRTATMRQGFGLLPRTGTGWLPAPGGSPPVGVSGSEQTVVNVAMQLIQVVMATPYGTTLAPGSAPTDPPQVGDWTMWAVVRDHTNRKFYFTTAFNGIMRVVDVSTALKGTVPPGESPPSFKSIPLLPSPFPWYEDVTAMLG